MNEEKYIPQSEVTKRTGKSKQWISWVCNHTDFLNTEIVLNRLVIINDNKLRNFLDKYKK